MPNESGEKIKLFFYKNKPVKNIHYLIDELYEVAYLLSGNQTVSLQLAEFCSLKTKLPLWRTKKEACLHTLWKEYKKQTKINSSIHVLFQASKTPLLKNLQKLSARERMIIILRYYKEYPIEKIAKFFLLSENNIRRQLLHAIPLWNDKKTSISLDQLPLFFQKEIAQLEFKQVENNIIHHTSNVLLQSTNSKKKVYFCSGLIALSLFFGGSIDDPLLAKSRVNPGPDIIKIYKEGTTVQQVDKKLKELGFSDCFVYSDYQSHILYISTENKEANKNQEKIKSKAANVLQEKNWDFTIKFEYHKPYDEKAEEEGMDPAAKAQEEQDSKILDELSQKVNFNVGENMDEEGTTNWEVYVSDDISNEKEDEVRITIQNILDKFNNKGKIVFIYHDQGIAEKSQRWYPLVECISEGIAQNPSYSYDSINLEFKNSQVEISILTNLLKGAKGNTSAAEEITRGINKFLQDKNIKEMIKDDRYTINIRSMGGSKIE
ncbi:sigma factor-like helix-turn-helix DNA-binding protein [Niallia sp. 03133]|uniref:sigma factor-like helix-turn-helix DNA-binding protein n=1 Tax=Niallia sp. 03133 TaxID=3458060 RepID=UPI0040443FAC